MNKKSLKSLVRSEKAVCENMHCSKLFNILRLFPDCDIIGDWSSIEQTVFRKELVGCVLATDMRHHHHQLNKFSTRIENAQIIKESDGLPIAIQEAL